MGAHAPSCRHRSACALQAVRKAAWSLRPSRDCGRGFWGIGFNLHCVSSTRVKSQYRNAHRRVLHCARSSTQTQSFSVQFASDATLRSRAAQFAVRKPVKQIATERSSETPKANQIQHRMTAVGDKSVAKAKEVAPFLKSLRLILNTENPRILRWTPDGKAFEIHDMDAMMRYVLPKYFKHGKYTSFQRQLNYFNFRKWTKSKAVVCTFSNAFFQRDQPALSWRITRKKSLHSVDPKKPACSKAAPVRKISKTKKLTRAPPKPIAIKLPASEASSPASFPSPTDAFSLANELDLRSVYGEVSEITFHEPLMGSGDAPPLLGDEHSLDWVDVLYSSLEPLLDNAAYPSFRDRALDYTQL